MNVSQGVLIHNVAAAPVSQPPEVLSAPAVVSAKIQN